METKTLLREREQTQKAKYTGSQLDWISPTTLTLDDTRGTDTVFDTFSRRKVSTNGATFRKMWQLLDSRPQPSLSSTGTNKSSKVGGRFVSSQHVYIPIQETVATKAGDSLPKTRKVGAVRSSMHDHVIWSPFNFLRFGRKLLHVVVWWKNYM